jgi:two-component sensor histidine kinase
METMRQQETFIERWAKKTQARRDREFYLVAVPVVVTVTGLTPHILQIFFTPPHLSRLADAAAMVVVGAAMVGVVMYGITRFFSSPRWWGPVRSRWPLPSHLLLLWTPVAILVDGPQRMVELTMVVSPATPMAHALPYALGSAIARTFLFAGGVVFFERLVGAVNESADQRARALRLETQVMKNLIQPHFLLNSLNAVRAYLDESPAVAEEMLLSLTSLLRRVIHHSALERVTLAEELATIRDYFAVMNRRYEASFTLAAEDIPEGEVNIPPLILFALVENSFKHGFSGRTAGVVTVRVERGDRLRIVVADDGAATGVDGTGAGSGYVEARLELAYGVEYRFEHGPRAGGGYEAIVELPWPKV